MADKHQRNKENTLFQKKYRENDIVLDPVIQNVFRLINFIFSNVKGKTKKYAGVCLNILIFYTYNILKLLIYI